MFLPQALYERLPLMYLGAAGACVAMGYFVGAPAYLSAAMLALCGWAVWSVRRRFRQGRRVLAPVEEGFAYPSLESRFRAVGSARSAKRQRPDGSPDFVDTWWVWDSTADSAASTQERGADRDT